MEITLEDTKETHTFDGVAEHKGIFQLDLTVTAIDPNTGMAQSFRGMKVISNMHVTLETLQKNGSIAIPQDLRIEGKPDTTAELLLALLESVEVYPPE